MKSHPIWMWLKVEVKSPLSALCSGITDAAQNVGAQNKPDICRHFLEVGVLTLLHLEKSQKFNQVL